MIQQPTIVVFDEFEKVYNEQDQKTKMLTLLDGVYPSKKLFVMTCNDKWMLDEHLQNRPGRVYYMIDYTGLDGDFITEYCKDNLSAKEHIPTICSIARVFNAFNFDMLKAMVEEMNRYGESPAEVLEFLNIQPHQEANASYSVKLFDNNEGQVLKLIDKSWYGNPLTDRIDVRYREEQHGGNIEGDNDGEDHNGEDQDGSGRLRGKKVKFTANDLAHMDGQSSSYIYVNKEGYRMLLKRFMEIGTKVNFDTLASAMKKKKETGALAGDVDKLLYGDDDSTCSSESSSCEYQ